MPSWPLPAAVNRLRVTLVAPDAKIPSKWLLLAVLLSIVPVRAVVAETTDIPTSLLLAVALVIEKVVAAPPLPMLTVIPPPPAFTPLFIATTRSMVTLAVAVEPPGGQ